MFHDYPSCLYSPAMTTLLSGGMGYLIMVREHRDKSYVGPTYCHRLNAAFLEGIQDGHDDNTAIQTRCFKL
jgi:hypothetical protein